MDLSGRSRAKTRCHFLRHAVRRFVEDREIAPVTTFFEFSSIGSNAFSLTVPNEQTGRALAFLHNFPHSGVALIGPFRKQQQTNGPNNALPASRVAPLSLTKHSICRGSTPFGRRRYRSNKRLSDDSDDDRHRSPRFVPLCLRRAGGARKTIPLLFLPSPEPSDIGGIESGMQQRGATKTRHER